MQIAKVNNHTGCVVLLGEKQQTRPRFSRLGIGRRSSMHGFAVNRAEEKGFCAMITEGDCFPVIYIQVKQEGIAVPDWCFRS